MTAGNLPTIYLCSNRVPNVTGVRIATAIFDRQEIVDPDWNKLLRISLEHGYRHFPGASEDKLKLIADITGREIVRGDASTQGRMYISSINVSIWREDANDALALSALLARNLHCRLEVFVHLKGQRTRLVEDLDEFIALPPYPK